MKKKMFILISFIFCLSLMLPISIQAAQRKESVIYSDFYKKIHHTPGFEHWTSTRME